METQPDYRIYPSLLDMFQTLLDYESEAEQPWNIVSETAHKNGKYPGKEVGDYILTPDEMYTKLEMNLIDAINRCDGVHIEAADKGTAFNEIVDCLIEHRQSSREDIKIHSEKISEDQTAIIAELNGFTFAFDANFCKEIAKRFIGSIPQYLCRSSIVTKYGEVELYGFIDEFMPTRICDIKTTSMYQFGKFEQKWQRHLYPYCVIESGAATHIDEFEYSVVVWKKGATLITGEFYPEVYTYNHKKSTDLLRAHIEHFLWWLNIRKKFITDKRIFGGVNAPGYVGQPINEKLLY